MFRHRDYYELQLAFMWGEILGTDNIYIRDDFFELGGDTQAAESFLAALKREFGADVSYKQFASSPTIEAVAVHVRAYARARGPKPSTARMQGAAPESTPIVIIHDVRGDVLDLQQIRGSNIGRPIIGVRTPGIDLEEEPLQTLDEMVDRYVADMLRIGLREPFLIAGNSNGGLIAYEMARKLEEMGRGVAYLGLFEASPADGRGLNADMSGSIDRLIREMCAMHSIPFTPDRLNDCFDALKEADQLPDDYSFELIMRTLDINAINLRASGEHRARGRFEGTAVLYESSAGSGDDKRPTGILSDCASTGNKYEAFWSNHLAPDTLVRRLRCSHRALFHRREIKTFLLEDVAAALAKFERI